MTIREFIALLGDQTLILTCLFAGIPLLVLLWGLIHQRDSSSQRPWKYGYTFFVFSSVIPGMFSAVLVAYTLFFTRENLLDQNFLVYILPLASMMMTLSFIRVRVSFADIPGFGRLSALMILVAICFALALAIDRTRIFLGFFGSIDRLFLLVAGLFAFLKVTFWVVFKRNKPEARDK